MKTKQIWGAVRASDDSGEFCDMDELAVTGELVQQKVDDAATQFPEWNTRNPVLRIVPMLITEVTE